MSIERLITKLEVVDAEHLLEDITDTQTDFWDMFDGVSFGDAAHTLMSPDDFLQAVINTLDCYDEYEMHVTDNTLDKLKAMIAEMQEKCLLVDLRA